MKKLNFNPKFKVINIYLKKFFALWLVLAIIMALLMSLIGVVSSRKTSSVSAYITFSYDGIENGLDPSGNKFSPYDIKSDKIIKAACKDVGIDENQASNLANSISIDGVVPSNIISKITSYKSIIGSDSVNSLESISDTSYYPTQYRISLKYYGTSLSREKAAELLNSVADEYKNHFYSSYGYNESIEKAVLAIDYNDYDYSEAVDVIDSYLDTLKNYVDGLSESDNTRFVSSETGYSFSDLSKSIDTLKNEDLDWTLSYIISNNVTKNKTDLLSYYNYKIKDLERTKENYQEQYDNVSNLVSEYVKTNTVVLGVGNDSQEYSYSQGSKTYDDLVNQKVNLQTEVSSTQSAIDLYKSRIQKLKSAGKKNGDQGAVEKQLETIFSKIETVLDDVNKTATDYYTNVKLVDACRVTQKANGGSLYLSTLKDSMHSIFAVELILLGIYFLVAFVFAIKAPEDIESISNSKKNKNKKSKKENEEK